MSFDLKVMVSTVHISLHIAARCSIPLSVFVLVTFRLSDGRTAERTAAQLDYMVESRLLHGNSLASQHYSVTNRYKLESVPRRLRSPCPSHKSRTAQRFQTPVPTLQSPLGLHQLTSSGGPHKRCPHTDGATVLCFTKHPFRRRVPLLIHEDLLFPTHPTPARCGERLFRTGLLLPMRPPSYRSRSSSIYLGNHVLFSATIIFSSLWSHLSLPVFLEDPFF